MLQHEVFDKMNGKSRNNEINSSKEPFCIAKNKSNVIDVIMYTP